MSENEKKIKFHVSPDLDYVYRDVFNVYAGTGDVVIEFGNQHRSMPENVTVSNRIVMSVSNAYRLVKTMESALKDAQAKLYQSVQDKENE
jgi:hypothetical protein